MTKKCYAVFVLSVFVLTIFGFISGSAGANQITGTEGFESGDFSNWMTTGDPVISTNSHSGSYGAQFIYNRGDGLQSLYKDFGGKVSSATVEIYVNITQWSQALADLRFDFTTPADNPSALKGAVWVWGTTGGYSYSAGNPDGHSGYFNPQLSMNEWNKITINYSDANGGVLKFFTNDTLRLTINNYGTEIGGFFIGASGCCASIIYEVDDISFDAILENQPPVADAGLDQAITQIGTTVQLDGNESWDPEGDDITYNWSIVSKPEGSTTQLSDPTSPAPTFQADIHGDYEIELVVSDASSSSTPDQIIVSFDNSIPIASAKPNQSVVQGETVCFDGSDSSDANGDPLSFSWTLTSSPAGSSASIDYPSSMEPCITTDIAGNYEVTLIVNDGWVDSEPSTASVLAISHLDAITTTLQEIIDAINTIDPANLKNKNMQKTLSNKVNAVLELVEQGAYAEALNKLQNDLLDKTDGCATSGTPDKNDWLQDCGDQEQLYPLITEAIGYLENM